MIQTGAQSNEQSLWDDAALLRYVSQTARRVIPVGVHAPLLRHGYRPSRFKGCHKTTETRRSFFGADRLTLLDDNDDDNDYNNNNNKSNSRPES